ncbi:MAG: hypothetical protein FRX48_04691 [Lasallia pustulata]|uniref:Uncharacterized protein n=1 Tax=Lasallia pustulata TaxID=136370 RepID=A0A5M8PS35_9LECA|nr:MAG: hypothetical protein FRX48_04691 [Lasallia pustulata]
MTNPEDQIVDSTQTPNHVHHESTSPTHHISEDEQASSPPKATTTTQPSNQDKTDWELTTCTPAYIAETYKLTDEEFARELDAFYGPDEAVQSSEAGEGAAGKEPAEEEEEEVVMVRTEKRVVRRAWGYGGAAR